METLEFAKWSVQQAIQEQVQKEDSYRWATTPDRKVEEVRKLVVHKERKLGLGFPLQILKYLQP